MGSTNLIGAMSWLVDTNVVSELRKGPRAHPGVLRWAAACGDEVFLSVLTVGEIRRGIELKRRRDPASAVHLDRWFAGLVTTFSSKILPVDARVAQAWARLNVPDPRPVVDSLIAATARVHDLTLVTRNTRDVSGLGVPVLNPFANG